MRRYDDPIEVRRGLLSGQEIPAQFIWRGRLWVVREVISHWIETGVWWEQPGVAALFGTGTGADVASAATAAEAPPPPPQAADLLGERDFWRVEATRGRAVRGAGVFDLSFDWAGGQWRLVSSID